MRCMRKKAIRGEERWNRKICEAGEDWFELGFLLMELLLDLKNGKFLCTYVQKHR